MKDMTKKAQMNLANLGSIAMALVVAVVIIGIMGTILAEIQGTQADNTVSLANNKSFTWVDNDTVFSFAEDRVSTGSVVMYCNDTKMGLNVNYTTNSSGVRIQNQTASDTGSNSSFNNCLYNMTFSYNIGSEAYNISNKGQSANVTLANFIPTIAIVAISAIIIGLVLVMFRRRQ